MEKKRLLQTLEQLQAELAQAERVDSETLTELERITGEVRRRLDERPAEPPHEKVEPEPSLRNLMLKYEAEHPQLAAAIGRAADALAAMGF